MGGGPGSQVFDYIGGFVDLVCDQDSVGAVGRVIVLSVSWDQVAVMGGIYPSVKESDHPV